MELASPVTGKVVETITGTPEHPFFVQGKGWVELGRLGIGSQIVTRAGPALFVKSVTHEAHPEGVAVYNFVVDSDHTYFVGSANGGAWVHNAFRETTPPKLPPHRIGQGKVVFEHYYGNIKGDHPPAHLHVIGGGLETKIGANGLPIQNLPRMTRV